MTGEKIRKNLSDEQKLNWVQLINSENVGPVTFRKLINKYGGAEKALYNLPKLSRNGGLKRKIVVCEKWKAEKYFEETYKIGAKLVAIGEPEYPKLLSHIYDPPPILCMKGNFSILDIPAIAIVGSRNASAMAVKYTTRLTNDLADYGFSIVSGLARGIDRSAHIASLNKATIAVIANGIDIYYPLENKTLQESIVKKGLLISENMPRCAPHSILFPRRNRIITGISYGLIVVEATKSSGSLISARSALSQNREVFAVPGSPLDPRSSGTNYLIKQGAKMVTNAEDVIEEMENICNFSKSGHYREERKNKLFTIGNTSEKIKAENININDNSRKIISDLLSITPVTIDEIIRQSEIEQIIIYNILLEMELAGNIYWHSGNMVSLVAQ